MSPMEPLGHRSLQSGGAIIAFAFVVLLGVVVSPLCHAREPKFDPGTSKVRVLYVGDTNWRTWRDIASDPFLTVSPVPASVKHFSMVLMRKSMRQYIPRTYESYVGKVDVLILSDTDRVLFTNEQQFMFREGLVEDAQGLIMAGGLEAFGGAGGGSSWAGSAVEDALPVECLSGKTFSGHPFLARPPASEKDHPFVTSLPWETMPIFRGMNSVAQKGGSILLLEARGTGIEPSAHKPVLVYGEIGKGSSLAHAPDWNPGWGTTVMNNWEYYPDYLMNMCYLVAGLAVPQDVELVHLVRTELGSYALQRSVTLSLLEFAELFGANVVALEGRLSQIGRMKDEADRLYLDQSYDGVLEKMAEIKSELLDIDNQAIKVKDHALFWVFLVEWLVVTGTSLAAGFVLWSLMVRRKAYREVGITRFAV